MNETELGEFLEVLSDVSEDGFESNEDDLHSNNEYMPEQNDYENNKELEDTEDIELNNNITNKSHKLTFNIPTDIKWKRKNLILNQEQISFCGNEVLPSEICNLSTPFSFFRYFFNEDIIKNIQQETNLYSVQKCPNKSISITCLEINQYIGICIMMSVVRNPSVRSYWSDIIGNNVIKECMPINRFEKIREFLHFNDNSKFLPRDHPEHDRLHKLRPLITQLQCRYSSVPKECCLSVDEQVCATKARHFLKQYLPKKPHKWGFKFFIICGVSGFAYNFEIYSGQENVVQDNEPDLGRSSNIVVRLCRQIERKKNYRVYFDNYFTSIPLISYLATEGIYSLGTIQRNRITNCKLPSNKEMKKEKRGSNYEFVGTVRDVDISVVVWKDTKVVTLASSFVGKLPVSSVERYDKKQKKKVSVDSPAIIHEYNKHMGGVDLLDSLIGRHKIGIRSKKWYLRIFYHLIDLTIVNAWILYKRVIKSKVEKGKTKEKILNLWEFRINISECLCKHGTFKNKRGRPSNEIDNSLEVKKLHHHIFLQLI